jgi:PAS domain S-box-containing protein
MDAPQAPADEAKNLQRSMSDVLSLMALPATWVGSDWSHVTGTLLEALLGMLHLDFAYVLLYDGNSGSSDMVRLAQSLGGSLQASGIGKALAASLGSVAQWPAAGRISIGGNEFAIASAPIGLQSEIGIIVAGSRRADFAGDTERLLLSVAANQAALALQEARLLEAQRRIANDLDRRVAQRTAELVQANEALQHEVAERRRTEDAIPAGIIVVSPESGIIGANNQLLGYLGHSLEVLKQWTTTDMVHPDDFDGTLNYFRSFMGLGRESQHETRIRRFDGVYRWFQVRNNPLRDADGRIIRWYGLLTDIDDRKQAEEALRESEGQLRLVVNTTPGLIATFAPSGATEDVNEQFLDYLGQTIEEFSNWPSNGTVHPADVQHHVEVLTRSFESGRPIDTETRLRRFDGVYRWFQVRGLPARDADGHIVRWYCLMADIDDRKLAEQELRRSEASLIDAQRVSSVGSFTWLPETDEVSLSEELYRIFEFDRAVPATFQQCAAMIDPDDRALFAERVGLARAGMGHEDIDIRLRMPDGRTKYLRTAARANRLADGRELFIGTIQDITQRRLAEDAVNELRTELAHVSRVSTLGAMTASIAHEVNQPLAGIITNASTSLRMLASDPPNIEGALETARRTIRDGNRAAEVVSRLRALFSKKSEISGSVDLNEAARDVVALSTSELRRNRANLELDLAQNLPPVTGDRIQLQQVILNLLLNAADALSNVEDRPRQITLRTNQDEDGNVRLIVQDTGVGIDPDNSSKIFDAFYTTKATGMGIGLSVSRSIIEHHGGRIWASANAGPGASFSFAIPRTVDPFTAAGPAAFPPRAPQLHPEGRADD